MRARGVVLVVVACGVLAASGAVLTLPAPVAPAPQAVVAVSALPVPAVDTGDRAAVARIWHRFLAPALAERPGWTGSVAHCSAGALSPAAQAATLTTVNVARRLVGEQPVRFSAVLSAEAQQAALVFTANQALGHTIPAGWSCASAAAGRAAKASDIALSTDSGGSGANAVLAYLDERGGAGSRSVTTALHRRLILDPAVAVMGSGSTDTANALWVRGPAAAHRAAPAWVPWPSAGWFPAGLEPGGRWSLSARGADFRHARAVVRSATGTRLRVTDVEVGADAALPTLVFQVHGVLPPHGSHPRSYTVTVSGIRQGGKTVSHRWTVRFFTP